MVRGAEPVKASATESVSTQAVKPSLSAHLVKAENLEKGQWAPWEGSVSPLVEEGPEVQGFPLERRFGHRSIRP